MTSRKSFWISAGYIRSEEGLRLSFAKAGAGSFCKRDIPKELISLSRLCKMF